MPNLEKEEWWLTVSEEQNDIVDIKEIGIGTHQLTLPCGCKQIQMGLVGSEVRRIRSKESESQRSQFFEFCKTHKK